MTTNALAKRLAKHIGVTTFSSSAQDNVQNNRGLVDGDLDDIALCITGALQEIAADAPAALSEVRMSDVLRAPTTVSLTATQYSPTISSLTTYASWMIGCTIRISGDGRDNEIVSSTELLRPYMGTSGSQSATVYADALLLPSSVRNVMEPVQVSGVQTLHAASSREEFHYGRSWSGAGLPPWNQPGYSFDDQYQKPGGEPRIWLAETRYDGTAQALQVFLRFTPMPQQGYTVTYRAKKKPPIVTSANIVTGPSDDTDPANVIPQDWHESILYPIALQRFTAHPRFASDGGKLQEIGRQHQVAKALLASFVPAIVATHGNYN